MTEDEAVLGRLSRYLGQQEGVEALPLDKAANLVIVVLGNVFFFSVKKFL